MLTNIVLVCRLDISTRVSRGIKMSEVRVSTGKSRLGQAFLQSQANLKSPKFLWRNTTWICAGIMTTVAGIDHDRPEGASFDAALNATAKKGRPDQKN